MKKNIAVLFFIFFAQKLLAQEDMSFNGVTIDETTLEEITAKYGKPDSIYIWEGSSDFEFKFQKNRHPIYGANEFSNVVMPELALYYKSGISFSFNLHHIGYEDKDMYKIMPYDSVIQHAHHVLRAIILEEPCQFVSKRGVKLGVSTLADVKRKYCRNKYNIAFKYDFIVNNKEGIGFGFAIKDLQWFSMERKYRKKTYLTLLVRRIILFNPSWGY